MEPRSARDQPEAGRQHSAVGPSVPLVTCVLLKEVSRTVVYIHGGGMICGSIGHYEPLVRQYVQWTGVPFLSVEYRLAPE